jgi:hypothetical protein
MRGRQRCATWIHEVKASKTRNLPTADVYRSCNERFSDDEECFAALIVLYSRSTDPDRQRDSRVRRIVTRNPTLRERIENALEHLGFLTKPRILWR